MRRMTVIHQKIKELYDKSSDLEQLCIIHIIEMVIRYAETK